MGEFVYSMTFPLPISATTRAADCGTPLMKTMQNLDIATGPSTEIPRDEEKLQNELAYYTTVDQAIHGYVWSVYGLCLLAIAPARVWGKSYGYRFENRQPQDDELVHCANGSVAGPGEIFEKKLFVDVNGSRKWTQNSRVRCLQ
jgi:hypothetical protein